MLCVHRLVFTESKRQLAGWQPTVGGADDGLVDAIGRGREGRKLIEPALRRVSTVRGTTSQHSARTAVQLDVVLLRGEDPNHSAVVGQSDHDAAARSRTTVLEPRVTTAPRVEHPQNLPIAGTDRLDDVADDEDHRAVRGRGLKARSVSNPGDSNWKAPACIAFERHAVSNPLRLHGFLQLSRDGHAVRFAAGAGCDSETGDGDETARFMGGGPY